MSGTYLHIQQILVAFWLDDNYLLVHHYQLSQTANITVSCTSPLIVIKPCSVTASLSETTLGCYAIGFISG